MRLFTTKNYINIGDTKLYTPGDDIYAVDEEHALLALAHHGRIECGELIESEEIESVDITRIVQIDSLLVPSKFQLN